MKNKTKKTKKIRIVTNPTPQTHFNCGEANGYIIIKDRDHPWFGKHYLEVDKEVEGVHGGLTYGSYISEEMIIKSRGALNVDDLGSWMIGWDTCHSGDTKEKWSRQRVYDHTKETLYKKAIEFMEYLKKNKTKTKKNEKTGIEKVKLSKDSIFYEGLKKHYPNLFDKDGFLLLNEAKKIIREN